jgi:flagellar motor switch protein FliM
MPYAMIEPIRDLLYSSLQGDHLEVDKRWLRLLAQQVQTAEVELVATLGYSQVTFNQIVKMKAGDVIALDIPEAITAAVDGVPVMECSYGMFNGQYALKVDKMLAGSANE